MSSYDQVFWLNVTNLVLGLITLACVLIIGYAAIRELRQRASSKATAESDDHAFSADGLGVTMADGGRKFKADEMITVIDDSEVNTARGKAAHEKHPAD
ncbi:MAG TPA: hypothetical protein VIS48_12725 [Candidatus Kryptonia bacterium]